MREGNAEALIFGQAGVFGLKIVLEMEKLVLSRNKKDGFLETCDVMSGRVIFQAVKKATKGSFVIINV